MHAGLLMRGVSPRVGAFRRTLGHATSAPGINKGVVFSRSRPCIWRDGLAPRGYHVSSRLSAASILRGETKTVRQKTLPQMFREMLTESPDLGQKSALTFQGTNMTYNDVDNLSSVMAASLLDMAGEPSGAAPSIGVLVPSSDKRIVALLSILKANYAYLPLDPVVPKARMEYIIYTAQPKLILTTKEDSGIIANLDVSGPKVAFYEDLLKSKSSGFLPPYQDSNPLVSVYFTSGSTGTPQGVPLATNNVLNRFAWQWGVFPYETDDVACHKTSLLFVDSLTEIFCPLLRGVPIAVAPSGMTNDPEAFIDFLENQSVSSLVLVPSLLKAMLRWLSLSPKGSKLGSLKRVVTSGEELPQSLARDFFDWLPNSQLVNYYGSTEITGDVTYEVYNKSSDVDDKVFDGHVSIGQPIWNSSVYVMDQNLQPVEEGQVGEMYIGGANVHGKYLGDTFGDRFVENPQGSDGIDGILFKTGDMVSISNGCVIFKGRTDSMVKIRGQRFDMAEVDSVIEKVSGVIKTKTLAASHTDSDIEMVTFYITESVNTDAVEEEMKKACKESLPDYAQPKFFQVDQMPLQPQTGKLDRQALIKMYNDSKQEVMVETSESEQSPDSFIIRGVIAKELGMKTGAVTGNVSFFDIGGNSINATAVVVFLRRFGYRINVSDILAAKCINDIIDAATRLSDKSTSLASRRYVVRPIDRSTDMEYICGLLARAFCHRNEFTGTVCSVQDVYNLFLVNKNAIIDPGLSTCVVDTETKDIVGCSINFDKDTELTPVENLDEILTFIHEIETPLVEHISTMGGRWFFSYANAVDIGVSEEDSLFIVNMLEEQTIPMAMKNGYDGIYTLNMHPVTVALGDVLGYKLFAEYPVATYEFNGTRPWEKISDPSFAVQSLIMPLGS